MRHVKGLCFLIISVSLFMSHLVETTDLFFDEDLLQINGPIYTHNPEALDTLHNYIRNFMKTGKKVGSPCVLEHQQKMMERREYYVVQLNALRLPYNRTVMRRLLNESFADVKKWPQYCQFHPFWQKPSDFHCDSATLKCCSFTVLNSSLISGGWNNQSETKSLQCSAITTTMKPMLNSALPPLPFSTSFSKSSTRRVYPTYAIRSSNFSMPTLTSPTPLVIGTEKPGLGTNPNSNPNPNTNETISSLLIDPISGSPFKNNSEIPTPDGQKSPSTNNTEFLYATLKNNGSTPGGDNITIELNLLSSTPPPISTTITTITIRTTPRPPTTPTSSVAVKASKIVPFFTSNSLSSDKDDSNCNSTDFSSSSSSLSMMASQSTLLFFLTLSVYVHFLK